MKQKLAVVLLLPAWFLSIAMPSVSEVVSIAPDNKIFTDFDSFVHAYGETSSAQRKELTQSFISWQKRHGGFPIIEEGGNVVFFYVGKGKDQEVKLVGDFRTRNFYSVGWDQAGDIMLPISEGSSAFFVRLSFEVDARLDYKFLIDGESMRDPLHSRDIFSGPGGEASELIMPEYQLPKEFIPRPEVPKGKVQAVDAEWAQPRVNVYLPASYNPETTYPVVYTTDGSAWSNFMSLPIILDNLIADRSIEPVIAVMVDAAKDRRGWHFYSSDYLKYIEKVVRHVDRNYSTKPEAEKRLHIGTSSGGRIALYAGFERPDLFLNVAMLSPSLAGPPHYYEPYFSGDKQPDENLNIWLSAGTYEGYIYEDTKTMEKYFKSADIKSKVIYTREGHSFAAWRNITIKMLKYFYQ